MDGFFLSKPLSKVWMELEKPADRKNPIAGHPLFWSPRPFLACSHILFMGVVLVVHDHFFVHDLFLRGVLVVTTFSHMLPRPFLAGCLGRPRPFLAGCFGRHDFFSHVAMTFSCGFPRNEFSMKGTRRAGCSYNS